MGRSVGEKDVGIVIEKERIKANIKMEICQNCDGTGVVHTLEGVTSCMSCGGSGIYDRPKRS